MMLFSPMALEEGRNNKSDLATRADLSIHRSSPCGNLFFYNWHWIGKCLRMDPRNGISSFEVHFQFDYKGNLMRIVVKWDTINTRGLLKRFRGIIIRGAYRESHELIRVTNCPCPLWK